MLDRRLKKKAGTDQAAEREKQRQIREYQKYSNAVVRICFFRNAAIAALAMQGLTSILQILNAMVCLKVIPIAGGNALR